MARVLVVVQAWVLVSLAAGCGGMHVGEEEVAVVRGGDLVAAGGSISRMDSVPGDVMLAGGDVDFDGWAGGDVLGAGGAVEIGGRVGGSVRAAGGQVRLEAEVGRNVTIAGGQVQVGAGSAVHGNAYLTGGEVEVEGSVSGLLRAAGGEIVIDGAVGDVHVEAERLIVGPGATIAGDLRYRATQGAAIDPGARILGETIEMPVPPARARRGFATLFRILAWLAFLVAGTVVVALFPGTSRAAEQGLRQHPAASLGLGLLWVLGVPIVLVLLVIVVVGIPLGLILGAVYAISLYLGRAVIALWIGSLALRHRQTPGAGAGAGAGAGPGPFVLRFLIGAVLLLVLGFIPVLGVIVAIVATVMGLGAVVWAVGSRSAPPASA